MSLLLLVGADLGLHGFPVHLEVLAELLELLVCLWFLVHLEETFAIGDHSIDMSLIVHSDLESAVPLVQLDVQLDGAVEKSCLQQS